MRRDGFYSADQGKAFEAALALDPIPASKVQSAPLQFAELDKHNTRTQFDGMEARCRDLGIQRSME